MLGAIIGDVAGSYYEVLEVKAIRESSLKRRSYEDRIKILDKSIPLFTENSSYTDDTVLTVAIMDSLLKDKDYEYYLRKYGKDEIELGKDKYGRSRFGKGFISWLNNESVGNSFGNGASMRVSPIGFYYDRMENVMNEASASSKPSHDTNEARIGACAVASAINLARRGRTKKEIKEYIECIYAYNLNFDLETLQREYTFKSNTRDSVPVAIYAFLCSDSFEDAIRKSLSIGGDSDTIAAIAGSISEAFYGIPIEIKNEVMSYIPTKYKKIIFDFYTEIDFRNELKKLGIYSDEMFEFLRGKIHRYAFLEDDLPWGVFPKVDSEGILRDIRVLVPEIVDTKTFLINIHEFTHAYELFNELGSVYLEDKENRELRARDNEKLILKLGGKYNG